MALGKGIGVMGRGANVSPESLAQRQKLAMQLYANSITPQEPERSWTQGAARLAQSLVSGYEQAQIDKDRQDYDQKQAQGMAALLGMAKGDNGDVTPETLAALPENQQAYLLNLQQQKQQYATERQDKAADRKLAIADKLEYDKEKRKIEPLNNIQDELYAKQSELSRKQSELQNPKLPAYLKPQVEEEVKQLSASIEEAKQRGGSIAAMSPSKTTINVDASQKRENARLTKRDDLLEEAAVKKEGELAASALASRDKGFRLKNVVDLIQSGKLTNINTSVPGKIFESALAVAGLPNDTAAIGDLVRAANDELIEARKRIQGQGTVTEGETKILAGTVLAADATMDQIVAYEFVAKQVENRLRKLDNLQEQWIKRYGSTTQGSEDGTTFREAVTQLYENEPLISYEEGQKRKQEAASRHAGAQQ
jgi:hypothetical protein